MAENPRWHRPCNMTSQSQNLVNKTKTYSDAMMIVWCVAFFVLLPALSATAQVKKDPQTIIRERIANHGTYYTMQNPKSPPLPFNPFPGLPVYTITNGIFLLDDRTVDYEALREEIAVEMALEQFESGLFYGGSSTSYASYASTDLWIEILAMTNNTSFLTLHGIRDDYLYQLQIKEKLTDKKWKFGEIVASPGSTNQLYFSPVATGGKATSFYRGVEGQLVVSIVNQEGLTHGAEPITSNGQPVVRTLALITPQAVSAPLTVWYELSGSAVNGTDYTNLSGHVTIPQGQTEAYFSIHPTYDTLVEFEESVTVSLVITNGYLVEPSAASVTIWIDDNLPTNLFTTVVTGLTEVAGLDYHPPTKSLLVSQHFFDVDDWSFVRINSNGVVTNWSTIKHLNEEKKICVVQTTANGFTQGEMYFGTPVNGIIGKVSADGTTTNSSWAVLTTNNAAANSLIRGSLYIDQTGIFGHDLIAVTGGNFDEGGEVWRINSTGGATLLLDMSQATNRHLEGVITLPNDEAKWGPWAGKAVFGAESKIPPVIHSLDTNGIVADFNLGIEPEDFDVIITNQDFYLASYNEGQILKLSQNYLTNYVGDLLVTQAGDGVVGSSPKVFIVRWNSTNSVFDVRGIPVITACGLPGGVEHGTFAPITLTNIPCQ
jgi:hypothetical protein